MATVGTGTGIALRAGAIAAGLAGLLCVLAFASVPLDLVGQAWVDVGLAIALAVALAWRGPLAMPLLLALSAAASLRYLLWRGDDTLDVGAPWVWCLAIGLLAAEVHAALLRLLGGWLGLAPRRRPPRALPPDPADWPRVDVFVRGGGARLATLRPTLLGALGMDWPADGLTVWLLDDRDRATARGFAEAAGCRYVGGADALERALAASDAPFVALLDAADVPTRGFLQLTLGLLTHGPGLAFVQTRRDVAPAGGPPGEESASGAAQDGADARGAALWTGGGGVLRRAALAEIGGFAADPLRTSLRLHRAGWRGAFLDLPVAPEQGPRHGESRGLGGVGLPASGRRWRGVSLAQRAAYLRVGLRALVPVTRVAFLTAPLVFLVSGSTVLAAPPLVFAAYFAPHAAIGLASIARAHGHWRRPVLAELRDTALALPPLPRAVVAMLLAAGCVYGAWLLLAGPAASDQLVLNTGWAALALAAVLGAFVAQRRWRNTSDTPHFQVRLPLTARLPGGQVVTGASRTLSLTTAELDLPRPVALDATLIGAAEVDILFRPDGVAVPARVIEWDATGAQLRWIPTTLAEEATLVRAVLGRADTWIDADAGGRVRASRPGSGRPGREAIMLLAGLLACLSIPQAQAAPAGARYTVRPIPGTIGQPSDAASPSPAAPPPAAGPAPQAATRTVIYTLRDLGSAMPLGLRGTRDTADLAFGIRPDEVAIAASLTLDGAMSPALLPQVSAVTVSLNGQMLASIPANPAQPAFARTLAIDPSLLQNANHLQFRLSGRYAADCVDPLSDLLWATVSDASTLTLTLQRLPPRRDLARLPAPFLAAGVPDPPRVPFVLDPAAGTGTLRAAGIVASWLGLRADRGDLAFPVSADVPATGDAVVVTVVGEGDAVPGLGDIDGPTLAMLPNPHDALGSLLVVAGRTGDEVTAAADALALGAPALAGAQQLVQQPALVPRRPYDAARWVRTDRPIRLGDLAPVPALQAEGYTGTIDIPFRTAPDLYAWRDRPYALRLLMHAPAPAALDTSRARLDVSMDGRFLSSLPLTPPPSSGGWFASGTDAGSGDSDRRVGIPPATVSGRDTLQFHYDARPARPGACGAAPADLRVAIDPESTLDLTAAYRFGELPNLAWFVRTGFPFTRMADLSETAVVLPEEAAPEEVSAYLDLIGRMAAFTGVAATGLTVVRPAETGGVADDDLLLVGTAAHMQAADPLLARAPVRLSGDRWQLSLGDALDPIEAVFGSARDADRARATTALSAQAADDSALLVGAESPLADGRSVVALLAGGPPGLASATAALADRARARSMSGDLVLLAGDAPTAYRIGPTYTVGALPFWLWPGYTFQDQPAWVLAGLLLGCALLVVWLAASVRQVARRRRRPR